MTLFSLVMCSACVSSRDPYCVWNDTVIGGGGCVKNTIEVMNDHLASVPTGYVEANVFILLLLWF